MSGPTTRVTEVTEEPPPNWDERTVTAPGGHVLQGTRWAVHKGRQGWRPRFVTFSDRRAATVLTHAQPPLPGFVAYAPRGPISAGDSPEAVALRCAALAGWLRGQGATILAVDPELDRSATYESALAARGFRPTEEIQPSRHRMLLPLPAGASQESVFRDIAKATRQRIRAAERAGTLVCEDPDGAHLETFARLVDATARRKGFTFAEEQGFLGWWRLVLEAHQARFLVATNGETVLGGLIVYLQGGHHATAFSADRADLRDSCPGTLHLLRWTAIRDALAAGVPYIDLGGVDIRGAREHPRPGDPTWGMYQHKASFGAVWAESQPAHEVVFRPWTYRAGLAGRAVLRALRRLRS
ncbi:MAG: peptidoglycan bridge formation glycyltransferase FemA/FemB family protein [Chloroflexota bacterium]|nr:peptidoglycan bridge formation glycyltransferase FemA/FemB family protein [Chloroflexota bacterium]